jgi:predicted metal-dependent phosphoesterase TrpH
MLRADFHIHTKYSMDCSNELEDIIKRCLKLGLNCIAIADHDAVEGGLELQKLAPFKVIVAEEILTYDGEIMGMFLKQRIASGIPIGKAIAAIKEQGGLVNIPHPFDPMRGLRLDEDEFDQLAPQIDLIEVFNARVLSAQTNKEAVNFAKEHNLPGTAGSDSHSIAEMGSVAVTMNDFNTPAEFLAALKTAKIVGKRASPLVHFHSTLAKIKKIF